MERRAHLGALCLEFPSCALSHAADFIHTSYIPPYLPPYIPHTYLIHTSYIPHTYLIHTSYIPSYRHTSHTSHTSHTYISPLCTPFFKKKIYIYIFIFNKYRDRHTMHPLMCPCRCTLFLLCPHYPHTEQILTKKRHTLAHREFPRGVCACLSTATDSQFFSPLYLFVFFCLLLLFGFWFCAFWVLLWFCFGEKQWGTGKGRRERNKLPPSPPLLPPQNSENPKPLPQKTKQNENEGSKTS